MAFNWFDVVMAVVVLASAVAGLRTGLARVVVHLVATVAGLLLGFWCYRLVGVKLVQFVGTPALADICGFLLIFCGVLILGSAVAALLANLFRWVGLSWFDHLLGGVAGLVRGVLVVAATAAMLVAFVPSPAPGFLTRSTMLPYASEVAAALAEAAPKDLKDSFLQQWSNLKHLWAKPKSEQGQVAEARV